MPEFPDIQSALLGATDSSPDVTEQDQQRQQLLQMLYSRANVAPETAARSTYDQMMGRDVQGVKGFLLRALAGAGEGVRQYQDPKYPGLYNTLVQQKEQQFKDTVPILRSIEEANSRRDIARTKSQDAALANITKLEIENRKILNSAPVNNAKSTQLRADSEKKLAEAKAAQEKGEYTKAQRLQEEVQTRLLETFGRKEATPEMANAVAFSPGNRNILTTPASELFSGAQSAAMAKATPNLIMKSLTGGGGRTSTSVGYKPERFIGEDNTVQTIYGPPSVRTTTSGGGGAGISPDAINQVVKSFTPGASPAEEPKTPRQYSQAIQQSLGVKPTPKPLAPVPTNANTYKLPMGYVEKDKKAVDQANSLAGEGLATMNTLLSYPELKGKMGKLFDKKLSIQNLLADPDVKLMPEVGRIPTLISSMLNRVEFIERFQFSGKQVNEAEIKQIKAMVPSVQDTYDQAVTKMIDFNLRTSALLANLYNKIDDASYRKFREASHQIIQTLADRAKNGKKVNELTIQEMMLPYLRDEAKAKVREQLKEEGRKRLKNAQ